MTNEHSTRRVDDCGRIMIPNNIRYTLNIHEGDELHVYFDRNGVYFSKCGDLPANERSKIE